MTSAAPFEARAAARVICRSRSSSSWRCCSRSTSRLRGRFGVLGVDALLLASALLLAQTRGARVPVVDLAVQPRSNLALDLVDLGEPPLLHLGEMLGNEIRDGVAERSLLDAGPRARARRRASRPPPFLRP